jgi:predicted thioesterase
MEDQGVGIGLLREATQEVTPARCASHIGSGSLRVYATPAMALFIEQVCAEMVSERLPEGHTSVGTALNLRHLAPTPVGDTVRLRAEITQIEANQLVFNVRVWDSQEKIGEATHQRTIIDTERFLKRVRKKASKA